MKRSLNYLSVFSLFFLVFGVGLSLFAQPPGRGKAPEAFGPREGSGLIHRLNRSLVNAGAAELSETQEAAIVELVQGHWENMPAPNREDANFGLFQEYGQAILDKDVETAKGIAGQIAEAIAARTALRMQAQVEFQVALLDLLDGSQLDALRQQHGDQGVLRLLGGPGRMGAMGKPGMHRGDFTRQ